MRIAQAPVKRITSEDAAALVQPHMWLDYGLGLCQPDAFDRALAARKLDLFDVKVRACLTVKPRAILEVDPEGEHFHAFNWHFSSYDRAKHKAGLCSYIPLNLGEVPGYYRRFIEPIDIVVFKVRPMDENGMFNFGPTNVWHRTLVERAKTLIVEVSPGLPHAYGVTNGVHVSEVDYVIQGDDGPPAELKNALPSDIDRAVASRIAGEIEDGACIQIGIGGMANAVCCLLKDARDLGIHTEMLIDGIIDLYEAGCITGGRKTLNPGKLVYTFALGTRALYSAIDQNRNMLCCPVEYTNSPDVISQNDKVVSINCTTQIDLQGQAASESDGHRHVSGTGGQLQFVRGAYASNGGKSFICLPSTYGKTGERRSRIVLELTPGNIVTTPRSDIMYVVTEYGIANLKGKSVPERAKALIGLAHPDFREELERGAREHGLIPRAFR